MRFQAINQTRWLIFQDENLSIFEYSETLLEVGMVLPLLVPGGFERY
jgi:hypothetical protein